MRLVVRLVAVFSLHVICLVDESSLRAASGLHSSRGLARSRNGVRYSKRSFWKGSGLTDCTAVTLPVTPEELPLKGENKVRHHTRL